MPEYIYLLHPFREGFFEHPTVQESQIMEQHFRYLEQACQAGKVLLAGPCLDNTFGLVLLKCENEDEARCLMLQDPSVRQNVMMAELHPIRLSLLGRDWRK